MTSVVAIVVYVKLWRRSAETTGQSASNPVLLCLGGSNTIGSKLAPALAQEFLKELGATDVKRLSGAAEGEQLAQGVLPGGKASSIVRVEPHGTTAAFESLGNGACDVVMTTGRISQEEITQLPAMGDMSSPSNEHLLGLDGIVVVVNAANPARSLSKDQVAAIFSGAISDWSQVGGERSGIHVYAADEKSESYQTFRALILGNSQLLPTAKRVDLDAAVADAVSADPAAVGFVSFADINKAQPVAVSEAGGTALPPNRFTIATEDYPLSRRLYLYTAANPSNAFVGRFLRFVSSKIGQDVVAAAGFVPQNLIAQEMATTSESAPSEYRRLTRGAGRLSLDFRFLLGRSVLDNKAMADLNRVVDFIGDLGYGGNNLLLFGFCDSTGTQQTNLNLSLERAQVVADELKKRGLRAAVVRGFGPYLPVATNDTVEGREKNRRVEVWLTR
jgi:phosphate transport system substrate-binding protein